MKICDGHHFSLAIDGPAASGKTVVGGEVARRLGIRFLDTGTMYRAVTWAAIERAIDPRSEDELSALAASVDIRLLFRTDGDRLLLDGEDVTDRLRLAEVDANVSAVSAVSGVREALVAQQRAVAADGAVVMSGRDIGTAVLPDASVKVFLTASVEARALRRVADMRRSQDKMDYGDAEYDVEYEDVLVALQERDKIDSERDHSPLRPAADSVKICSDDMTVEEVTLKVLALVRQC